MGNVIDTSKPVSKTRQMSGRRVIKSSVKEITNENVVTVLQKALNDHALNRSEIDYLWKYYKGEQPIQNRTKEVRPEICNRIVENRANEIVSFKVGYGKGMGKRQTWGFYEDGELRLTHGTPAIMPMYNALKTVCDEIAGIAKEVFG